MSDHRQSMSEPFSERMRLIRFRMKREELRFLEEIRLVPRWLVWVVTALFVITEIGFIGANQMGLLEHGETWPPGADPFQGALVIAAVSAGLGIPVACLFLLVGYVNRDARRRGMHATLWTLLVIVLLPAYLLTGFIIYFLIREPLPYQCAGCGAMVSARFNYCPRCKCNLRPSCPQCKREVGDQDRYCPYCGYELADHEPAAALPRA